jgi:hypothetical protein
MHVLYCKYPCRKGGVMETFTPCLPTVKKGFKNAYRIETTIKHDINVSITPPFLQQYVRVGKETGNAKWGILEFV